MWKRRRLRAPAGGWKLSISKQNPKKNKKNVEKEKAESPSRRLQIENEKSRFSENFFLQVAK